MVPKRFRFEDIVVENETPADILIKKEEAAGVSRRPIGSMLPY